MESSFNSLSLFLLFLTFSSLVLSDDDDDYTGVFNMKAGSDCKYNVMHFDEDGIVGFRVQCSCPGTRKKLTYSCAYFGKPNICPGFNDTMIARANFYSELASYVKGYGGHGCSSKEIQADRVTTICKGTPLILKRTIEINGDDPRLCNKRHSEL